MKKVLLLLFLIFSFILNAQLDREHWFAPMFDGQTNGGNEQFLHLSTNETTPFNVKVYSNNILVAQKIISKGNPGVIAIDRDYIITTGDFNLLTVINKGLYIKADKPCFANLRFGVTNHTEIITSKGTAGIGTKFYTVVAPSAQINSSQSTNLGFAASFFATEDNTTITVNNFKKPLIFNNYGAASSFTFILNKGQSYIIDGRVSNTNNKDGFIGAEVNADKPISMSNGNFNGQYATTNSNSGSDILMDQSVPVDKLGDEFVIVKGYGIIGNKMEGAIIVSTEPNTAIYLNDATIPAKILLNPGDYYLVDENSYINRGNEHYNLHIITDKNVYVYQLLAGVASGSAPLATGGMNYIPPLNCYLPKKIDEISYINYLSDVPHSPPFSTKLNIITEKDAIVKVNGIIPSSLDGPYDISTISSNQNWVSYSIPNVTGNIKVESTKAVTAGIASGNAAFGYGGYFAGFSSIPLILKTDGDCLPGVKLEVTEGFDSYKWYNKDNPTTVLSTDYFFNPSAAGIYYVIVKQGSCPEIQTKDFKFYNCTTFTNYDYETCTSQKIIPKFALSSQTVNQPTLKIDTPPTKGVAVINSDGTITYTANPNSIGTDTFKFSFCGNATIPDCETVQATIKLNQIEKYDVVLSECSATSTATYNLTLAAISPDTTVTKKYFSDAAFSNQISTGQLANYNSAPGFVYVQMSNSFGCSTTAKIELKIVAPPIVNPSLYTSTICDENIDGIIDGNYKINLTTITPTIVQNPTNFTVRYFANQQKAIDGLQADNISGTFTFTSNISVWIRVDSPRVCPPVIKEVFLKTGTKATLITSTANKQVCDLGEDNTEPVNLEDYISLFTTASGGSATYFNSLIDAQNNQNIPAIQTITADRTFYYRLKVPGFCEEIGTLNLILSKGTPTALLDSYTVCEGSSIALTAETSPVYNTWLWKKGTVTVSTTENANLSAGIYTIFFTNSSGCVFSKNITVVDSPKAQFNISAYNATHCDDNFDGNINVKFSDITPIILPNASLFTVQYSLFNDFSAILPNNFSYSANTTVYVRATSTICSPEIRQIEFKLGDNFVLNSATATTTICDNDLDGTETISLANYRNLFTPETGFTTRYFDTLAEAQNNTPTINVSQPISGNKTFYFRFKKTDFCDAIGTLNIVFKAATPTALLDSYKVCEGSSITLAAESSPIYNNWLWKKGSVTVSDTKNATLSAGIYTVFFTNPSGCVFSKNITVVDSPKPILDVSLYNSTLCDSNFDGNSDPVNFNTITPIIVTNFAANPGIFTVKYYLKESDQDLGNNNTIPNLTNFTFSTNTTVYFRINSPACPFEKGKIEFKFGNNFILNASIATTTICDNDLDGTETISLANYRNLFTTETGFTTRYFATLQEAKNNTPTINVSQPISGNKTFYFRFKKTDFCDVIGTLNIVFKAATPTALLDSYKVCEGSSITLTAESSPIYNNWLWKKGSVTVSDTKNANLSAGIYTVFFTNLSGCVFSKNITVIDSPKPVINVSLYNATLCDIDFNGNSDPINFNTITPIIVTNFAANPGIFTIKYYLKESDRDLGNNNTIPNLTNFTFTTNTTVYFRVNSSACPFEKGQIDFKFGNNLPLLTTSFAAKICDDDFDGTKEVKLTDYVNNFYIGTQFTVDFFRNLSDAQNNKNPISDTTFSLTNSGTYYLRFHKNGFCDSIGKLEITIQKAVKSDILKDQNICPEKTTDLDAGAGFDGYIWSTGEITQIINVPVGDYYVDLLSNGCTFRQNVSVKAVELPKIVSVEIKGSTITVNATGGNPPYQYALDSQNYQSSNIFTNVRGGDHTVYVKSVDNCDPVSADINVIELYNVITPNGDGINDVLNYSKLLNKEEPYFQIFDRYGKIVFKGDQDNKFSWDGKAFGKTVNTGSYWFIIKWREPGFDTMTENSGWILVKNRE